MRIGGSASALAAALIVVVASAGAAQTTPPVGPPQDVPWVLRELVLDGQLTDVPDGVEATLLLDDGLASGSAGCNSWSGPYTIDGETLTFGTLMNTAMLCADGQMAVEAAFLAGLGQAATYTLDRNGLTLLDAGGQPVLTFDGTEVASIAGAWVVGSYRNTDGDLVEPVSGSLLTVVFGDDGSLEGSSGCNHYSAWYSVDRDGLLLGPLSSTKMACASPDLDAQESAFLAALAASDGWSQDGVQMDLIDASGVGKDTTVKLKAESEASYVGSWVVTGFDDGAGNQVAPLSAGALTAVFGVDGTIEGASGCNSYAGPYTVSGSAMTIGPLATTLAACDGEVGTQEQLFLAALQTVTGWGVDGTGIVLSGVGDSPVVVLAPAS